MSDKTIEDVQRELAGTQEMLGFILLAVGEPVVVSKATLEAGIPAGATINIDEHTDDHAFIFSVTVPEGESE